MVLSKSNLKPKLEDQDVYTRISYKAHNAITYLDLDERDKLENLAIEYFAEDIRKMDDEKLLQYAMDKGLIL